ncbi:hypothetical protein MMC18_003069 [Xylographa bjoerkii]|nr:hypothetical protein [Xylographa bjoerkii]
MVYKPEALRLVDAQPMDVTNLVSKRDTPQSFHGGRRIGSGATYRELEMPEAAPLVFPLLDDAIQTGGAQKPNALKKSHEFLADYYDRRAQAAYSARSPDSSLKFSSEIQPKFASRFSDPNDPISNGSLIALITNEKWEGQSWHC